MRASFLKSYFLLLQVDLIMHFRGLQALHTLVRKTGMKPVARNAEAKPEQLCHAVDLACVFYFKRVLCLQRSAATTILLRRLGVDAQMVIGAQLLPFKSHAWVERDGEILNDKPYMQEIYQVLERC